MLRAPKSRMRLTAVILQREIHLNRFSGEMPERSVRQKIRPENASDSACYAELM